MLKPGESTQTQTLTSSYETAEPASPDIATRYKNIMIKVIAAAYVLDDQTVSAALDERYKIEEQLIADGSDIFYSPLSGRVMIMPPVLDLPPA